MDRSVTSFFLAICFGMAILVAATPSQANKLDLTIGRFINCEYPSQCSADIARYERFMAEYAFGLSPKLMAPASTLGYSGFYMALEGSLTPVPDSGDSNDRRWYDGVGPADESPGVMFFPSVHIRKGLPWSMELGGTINYLSQSELVGLGADVKWSIFEGYKHGFRGVLPDVAARGSVVRVLGQSDIDMTIIGVDASMSYPFGIGGMLSLTPYLGWQYLWTLIRTEPLTYREDVSADDSVIYHPPVGTDWDTTGLSGPNLERMKLFLGFVLQYELLVITIEIDWGLATDWDTAVENNPLAYQNGADQDPEQLHTEVDHQIQINGGVGMQF
jgi:hypothetical protein